MISEIKIFEERECSFLLLARNKLSLIRESDQKDMLEGKRISSIDLLDIIESFDDDYKKSHESRGSLGFNILIRERENVRFRITRNEARELQLRISFKNSAADTHEINKQNFILKEVKKSLLLLFPSYFD